MHKGLAILLAGSVILSGCGRISESRANPFNWFGGDEEVREASKPETAAIPRDDTLLDQVLGVKIAPHPGGIIMTATGLAPTQGYFDVELVEVSREGRTLMYELRAKPPTSPAPVGAAAAREVVAGLFVSRQSLRDARTITVVAAQNRRSVRQR